MLRIVVNTDSKPLQASRPTMSAAKYQADNHNAYSFPNDQNDNKTSTVCGMPCCNKRSPGLMNSKNALALSQRTDQNGSADGCH